MRMAAVRAIGLVLCFGAVVSEAQILVSVRTYRYGQSTEVRGLASTSDRGFVLVGWVDWEGWIAKTDEWGEEEWRHVFEAPWGSSLEAVAVFDQIWAVGHITAGPFDFITLRRYSLDGREGNVTNFGTGHVGAMLRGQNTDWIICGAPTLIAGIDTAGSTAWSYGGPPHESARAMGRRPIGGVVVACDDGIWWNTEDTVRTAVFWFNERDALTDSVKFALDSLNHVECLLPVSQDEVIVGGYTQAGDSAEHRGWVAKVRRSGVIEWITPFGDGQYATVESVVAIVSDGGRLWVVANDLSEFRHSHLLQLAQLSANGTPIGLTQFDLSPQGESQDHARAAMLLDSAQLIIAGATDTAAFVAKIVLPPSGSISERPRSAANPELQARWSAGTGIELTLPVRSRDRIIIVIHDVLGREVKRIAGIAEPRVVVPFRGPAGKYFVSVSTSSQLWQTSFLIVR